MVSLVQRIVGAGARRIEQVKTALLIKGKSKVIHGPSRVLLSEGQCGVLSLMKDAEYFIEEFLRHHFTLGVSHICIVDNGSTDNTVAIASSFPNVTVVQNFLEAKKYESRLRAQVSQSVFKGGWCLFVDADELFEVPLDAPLLRLVDYLNHHRYTAMLTQMLDMFLDRRYSEVRIMSYSDTIKNFRYYSLNEIKSFAYHDRDAIKFNFFLRDNVCLNENIKILFGGLRHEVFGENCCLSKHSLVKNGDVGDAMSHPHCASGVRVADVTGVLRHFKFAGNYLERDQKSVSEGTWSHGEDRKRLTHYREIPDFKITCAQPLEYDEAETLVDQGFLVASDRYRDFIRSGPNNVTAPGQD